MDRHGADIEYQDVLRRLAIGDPSPLEPGRMDGTAQTPSALHPKAAAFVRLAATLAMGSSAACYQGHVDEAFAAGATVDEIVGVLIAVGPTVGLARAMLAASPLGMAVGYDTDAALEQLDAE
jgi:alkylhydroperoxidase/carboxymuconolactone decarboxylase family protein YurZ